MSQMDYSKYDTFRLLVRNGDVEAIKQMVLSGEAPDVNNYGMREGCLYVAARCGHINMCQYLIELGADINPIFGSPLEIAEHKDTRTLFICYYHMEQKKVYYVEHFFYIMK